MKNKFTRIQAVLLAVLLLVITVVSVGCGNTGNGDATSATTTVAAAESKDPADSGEGTTEVVYTFPEEDFKGADFNVFMRNADASSYPSLYLFAEEASDVMSSAVYNRNAAVEDKYKVVMKYREATNPSKSISNDIQGGSVDYDVVLDQRKTVASQAKTNNLVNLHKLNEYNENLDFDNTWWDANAANDYDIHGKLFFMPNDVSVSNLGQARFFCFNKDIITNYKLDNPYDLYKTDDWVLEKFLSLVSSVYEEDASGGLGTYGLIMETGSSNGNVMHLLVGCGIRFTEFTGDGSIISNVANQKTDDILSVIKATLLGNGDGTTNYVKTFGAVKEACPGETLATYDLGRAKFAQGHFLFVQMNMNTTSQLTEMNSYGVVVNPKYNKDQDRYYHKMDPFSIIWAVPNDKNVDLKKIAYVMDYWAYESSKTVMPTYYEITIKNRRVQDPTASEMLDVVKGSIIYDIADIFDLKISGTIYDAYTSPSGSITQAWKTQERAIKNSLDVLIKQIDSLD